MQQCCFFYLGLFEEIFFYPFGLTMAGISSKAVGKLENKYKFNEGTELTNDLGLEWYETSFRSYDSQLGRFHQIDPVAGVAFNFSPYTYVQNNPLLFNDPLGLDSVRTGTKDGGNTATAQNKDGTVGTYVVDPNNPDQLVGTGMSGSSEVTVSSSKKSKTGSSFGGFHWPTIRKGQGEWNDEMYSRIRDNKPLIQLGDPNWLQDQIPFHLHAYQAEQEYRQMSMAGVLILASPLLITMAPELLVAMEESALARSAQFVLKNEKWLNKGNWWRLGRGWNPATGTSNIRLAWGAHEEYLMNVPKHLRGLNQLLRGLGGGHKHFPNWKP